jgi:hypothetical protein
MFFVFEGTAPRWAIYATLLSFALLSFVVNIPKLSVAGRTGWRMGHREFYNDMAAILHWLGVIYFWLFLIAFPPLALLDFVETVYPRIPQELGGVKPRCAYLDVDTSKLSYSSQIKLNPGEDLDGEGGIRRTGQLLILYSSDSFLVVRPGDAISGPMEMARDSITAIRACESSP